MSYIELALRTEQAKQSYGVFLIRLLETGSVDQAFNALESEARRNGAWNTAKFALFLDFLSGLAKRF